MISDKLESAREPAVALGTAIQLINILRDATPDVRLGRVYLPQDLLQKYGVCEDDIVSLQASPEYCRVVQLVAERAAELLATAEQGKRTLPGFLPVLMVQIIIELYREYLIKLENMGYNNLQPRPDGDDRVRIGTVQKLAASWKALNTVLRGE